MNHIQLAPATFLHHRRRQIYVNGLAFSPNIPHHPFRIARAAAKINIITKANTRTSPHNSHKQNTFYSSITSRMTVSSGSHSLSPVG